MIGIIELLRLVVRVWLAMNASKPFRRLHEIDREMLRLSVGATESSLVQIEALDKERRILAKLIGTLHTDLDDKS